MNVNPDLLARLHDLKPEDVNEKRMEMLQPYMDDPAFTPDVLVKWSVMCKAFCFIHSWHAMQKESDLLVPGLSDARGTADACRDQMEEAQTALWQLEEREKNLRSRMIKISASNKPTKSASKTKAAES